jgi:hypothetical protein
MDSASQKSLSDNVVSVDSGAANGIRIRGKNL